MTSSPTPPKRLLIVEDDPNYRLLITGIMADAGFTVCSAGTLEEALMVANDSFSAVTLDLWLPDAKGDEALIKMRKRIPGIPIIIISGNISWQEHDRLIHLGADACFDKPPTADRLPAEIGRAILMRTDIGMRMELRRCGLMLSPEFSFG